MNTGTKANEDKRNADRSSERINNDFRLFGIPDEDLPPYTNAREFSRRFRRCSVLRMDEVRYAIATGADASNP